MAHGMRIITLALLTVLGNMSLGCDNKKVSRGRVDDPEAVADDQKFGGRQSSGDEPGVGERPRGDDSPDFPSGTDSEGPSSAGEEPTASGDQPGGDFPSGGEETPTPSEGSAPTVESGGTQSAEADLCSNGDTGACFRAARPLVASSPTEAISFYSQACDSGQRESGDSIACLQAGLLSERVNNSQEAAEFFEASCHKSDRPVLWACQLMRR